MDNEGMISESCFQSEDENAVYCFMESNDFRRAFDIFRNSASPIDNELKVMQETTFDSKGAKELKVLYNFHSTAR